MALLALAVSGGPFIGLFGTVLGVMDTFAAVGQEGQANFSAIAPGVAGALLTTVLGLVVAIPALFAFNLLQRRIQGLELDMTRSPPSSRVCSSWTSWTTRPQARATPRTRQCREPNSPQRSRKPP